MAIIHQDGFEVFGPDFPITRDYFPESGSWEVQQPGRFGDSKSIRTVGGTRLKRGLPAALASIAGGYSCNIDSLSQVTSEGVGIEFLTASGSLIFAVGVDSMGRIVATTNNLNSGIVATSAKAIDAGVWFHLGFEITRHSSTGSIKVYVNGAQIISATNVNTGNEDYAGWRFRSAPGGGIYTYFDDLYLCDTAAWLGECRISPLVPTADTAQKDFAPSIGSDNFECVNDLPANTSDWVSSSTVGAKDLYEIGDLPFTPLAVLGIRVAVIAKKNEITTRTFRPIIKSGGTSANGSTKAAASDYALAYDIFEKDPNTDAAWTKSGIDALQVGVEVVA